MAQKLKDEINNKICDSALKTFARFGYLKTKMSDISKNANISTGNIYHYYKSKEQLFYYLIDETFVNKLKTMTIDRFNLVMGVDDFSDKNEISEYLFLSEQQLDFCINNKYKVIIILDKSKGTKYEYLKKELIELMTKKAIEYYKSVHSHDINENLSYILGSIYTNFIYTFIDILRNFNDEKTIKNVLKEYLKYHQSGLLNIL